MKYKSASLMVAVVLLIGIASAQEQYHPFSELRAEGTDLDFDGQALTDASEIEASSIRANDGDLVFRDSAGPDILVWNYADVRWDMLADVHMNDNELQGFFNDVCGPGKAAVEINDDGTLECAELTTELSGEYVNKTGDYMEGDLDMDNNNILNVGDLDGSDWASLDIDQSDIAVSHLGAADANLDMNDQQIQNFFDDVCGPGMAAVEVNDDGSLECAELTTELSGEYVNKTGDYMTGTLDMDNNNIIGIGDLSGTDIVDSAQISGGAVGSSELDETDTYSLDWNNLDGVNTGDVAVSDLGAADANLDMNDNEIQNLGRLEGFFSDVCPGGEAAVEVNDDGTLECTDVASEVHGDYVNKSGDYMTGPLDIDDAGLYIDAGSGTPIETVSDINYPHQIWERNDGTHQGRYGVDMGWGNWGISNLDSGERGIIKLTDNDNVNIGSGDQTNDGYQLQVYGDARVNSGLSVGGNLDMNDQQIQNFFDDVCPGGTAAVEINDDGSLECAELTTELSGEYVNKSGDYMTGNLEMDGNNIIDIGDLQGTGIVDSAQISGGAVGSSELDETDTYSLDWGNLDGVDESDVAVSDLGAADANLDMNNQQIQNFFSDVCGPGMAAVEINDDGTLECADIAGEVSGEYVNKSGDYMTGDLEIDSDGDGALNFPVQGNEGDIRRYVQMQSVYGNNQDNVEAPGSIYWRTSTSSDYGAFIGGYRNDNDGGDPSFGIWLANNVADSEAEEILTARSDSSGTNRIGIGTNSPSYKLDVAGDTRVQNNLELGGTMTSGTVPTDRLSADSVEYTAGDYLTGGGTVSLGGSTTLNVDPSNIDWTDTAMDESDIEIGHISPATSNLDMNNNQLQNVGGTDCAADEALLGDGTCGSAGGGSMTLAEVLNEGNIASQDINMDGNSITGANQVEASEVSATDSFQLPVGQDAY